MWNGWIGTLRGTFSLWGPPMRPFGCGWRPQEPACRSVNACVSAAVVIVLVVLCEVGMFIISPRALWKYAARCVLLVQVFAGHEAGVTTGLFSPDGRTVITGGAEGAVRLWAPKKGTCKHVFSGYEFHQGAVTCLAAHPLWESTNPDGTASAEKHLVMSGSEDGTAKLIHVGTKRVVASFAHSQGMDPSTAAVSAGDEVRTRHFALMP